MSSADNTLAGASDTTGTPLQARRPDEAIEIHPVTMYGKYDVPETDADLYDFTPVQEEEVIGLEDVVEEDLGGVGPKGSSAPGSVLSEIYEQVKTPAPLTPEETASLNEQVMGAGAGRDSIEDEESPTGDGTGLPTSNDPTTTSGSATPSVPDQT